MIRQTFQAIILLAIAAPVAAQTGTPAATMAKPAKTLKVLQPGEIRPELVLAAPPARGSATEGTELAAVRALIASAMPARMEQARWDDVHEDPSIFDTAIGGGFEAKKFTATYELLSLVNNDTGIVTNVAKKIFNRTRPWGVDVTLPNCDAGRGKQPVGSYPSGHSTLAFSVGYALAQLMPDKAPVILARAKDYALSREYCGVHFASDSAASQVLATLATARILAAPALQPKIAAARAELKAAGF